MTTLTDFLQARIADDEAVARGATPGPWEDTGTVLAGVTANGYKTVAVCNSSDWGDGEYSYPATTEEAGNSAHIARWDPAHVLSECDAKRKIVDEHRPSKPPWPSLMEAGCRTCGTAQGWDDRARQANCVTLRALALPYADHEEYRPEWKPT